MKPRLLVLLLSALLGALPVLACQAAPAVDGVTTAECPVCKHEGDLACLCVHIQPDTPSCECAGTTYYFCSDGCRADFQEHPERYLGD